MLKIIHTPHPILEKPVKEIKKIDEKIKKIIKKMEETLLAQKDPPGVGLAANQVGFDIALFITRPNLKNEKINVYINPKILKTKKIKRKKGKKIKLEGCLSIPKIWGEVEREDRVLLEYQDISGDKKTEWFADFEAIIIQHEVDHLQGVVFTKRVIEQGKKLYQEKNDRLEVLEI